MWTFKSKFAAWALRLAPALRVELRLADLESAELTVTQSRNIYLQDSLIKYLLMNQKHMIIFNKNLLKLS